MIDPYFVKPRNYKEVPSRMSFEPAFRRPVITAVRPLSPEKAYTILMTKMQTAREAESLDP